MNASMEPVRPPRRRIWPIFAILLVIILLFAIAPILSALSAGMVADMNGCALDEGSVHPCLIGGVDYGETLYAFGVAGWLGLITLPFGGIAFLVWLVALIVTLTIRFRANRRQSRTSTTETLP